MSFSSLTSAVAAEHTRDLQRAARLARLSALARCCTPSAWHAAWRRVATRVATLRGQRAAAVCPAC